MQSAEHQSIRRSGQPAGGPLDKDVVPQRSDEKQLFVTRSLSWHGSPIELTLPWALGALLPGPTGGQPGSPRMPSCMEQGAAKINSMTELQLLREISQNKRIGIRGQLFGTSGHLEPGLLVESPFGKISVQSDHGEVSARGAQVPPTTIYCRRATLAALRHGVKGEQPGHEILIRREKFGLRRGDRDIDIIADIGRWRTLYKSYRHWKVVRADGSLIFKVIKRDWFLSKTATPSEASLVLALVRSGIVETSSLLSFLTLP
jgi:hypothetical protein